jgi:hypothetical protein
VSLRANRFEGSVSIETDQPIQLVGKGRVYVQLRNSSDLDFHLELAEPVEGVTESDNQILPARKINITEVQGTSETAKGKRTLSIPFRVTNLLVDVDTPLSVNLKIEAIFSPKA